MLARDQGCLAAELVPGQGIRRRRAFCLPLQAWRHVQRDGNEPGSARVMAREEQRVVLEVATATRSRGVLPGAAGWIACAPDAQRLRSLVRHSAKSAMTRMLENDMPQLRQSIRRRR